MDITPTVVPAHLSMPRNTSTISQSEHKGVAMNTRVARRIAHVGHHGQVNRFGEPVVDHVERVAAAVPREARSTALLHDLLELTSVDLRELVSRGLTADERAALMLLTRRAGEPYEAYVRRIACARDDGGRIAQAVKIADLDDHLAHSQIPSGAPPYAWARRWMLEHAGARVLVFSAARTD